MDTFIEAPAGTPTEASLGLKSPDSAPAPAPEIKVSQMQQGDKTAAPPKKGSAKESIFSDLRKRFGEPEAAPAPDKPEDKKLDKKTDEKPAEKKESVEPEAKADDKSQDKKVNPWKLVEDYKKQVKERDEKLAEMQKAGVPPEKLKPYEDKLAAAEKRLQEVEQEIRYVNYQKSQEFQDKYQKPYDEQWRRAMTELSEVTVVGDGGEERAIEPKDLLELVNLNLRDAKALADEKFGDFADEVMQHRKEIRRLFDEQTQALDKAKKDGVEYFKQREEAQRVQMREVSEQMMKGWNEANEAAASDPKYGKYFTPAEGDQEGNQRLAKGFELADRAFSENPMNAKTAEERKAIIQRHAAVRNRAAAFGRLVHMNEKKDAQIAELIEKLKQYEQAEPPRAGGSQSASPAGKTSAKDSIFKALRDRAK